WVLQARAAATALGTRWRAAQTRGPGQLRVKSTDWAANETGGGTTSARNTEPTSDRLLDPKMAPPVAGMCSPPVTLGRHSRCRIGPTTARETRYFTQPSTPVSSAGFQR